MPKRILLAGTLTAIADGLFSSVLNVVAYHSTVARLFQGVAAVLLGQEALAGGTRTAAIGVLIHCGVALWWSAVFAFVAARWALLGNILRSGAGIVAIAAIYGPFVWMVMSLLVIPAFLHRPTTINARWWVQFVGHFPFVGLPVVASIAGLPHLRPSGSRRSRAPS
jgi:hypothetical protein